MVIDGRTLQKQDVARKLKEYFSGLSGADADVEVLLGNKDSVISIRAFCKLSGYESDVKASGGHYAVRVFGSSCRCG